MNYVHGIDIVSIIFSIILVLRLRRNASQGVLQVGDKILAGITMFLTPLIPQAIYYYALRNNLPTAARTLNILGFIVFIPAMILQLWLFNFLPTTITILKSNNPLNTALDLYQKKLYADLLATAPCNLEERARWKEKVLQQARGVDVGNLDATPPQCK